MLYFIVHTDSGELINGNHHAFPAEAAPGKMIYNVLRNGIQTVIALDDFHFTGIMIFQAALLCLMISGVCDMFDGKIASTMERTKQQKRFGIQIDSLSDLICFGVLPAVIVYQVAGKSAPSFYIGAAYLLCALIRLAWFNVDEEERQETSDGAREVYLGLPVTMSALFLPAVLGIGRALGLPLGKLAAGLLLLMGAAFLTPFRLKKPALLGKLGMLAAGSAGLIVVLAGVDP